MKQSETKEHHTNPEHVLAPNCTIKWCIADDIYGANHEYS